MDAVIHVSVFTSLDWKEFRKTLDKGLYAINHPSEVWHFNSYSSYQIRKYCVLRDRIVHKYYKWNNSHVRSWHDSQDRLWIDIDLPDRFCETCDIRIPEDRDLCQSCTTRTWHSKRDFFPDRTAKYIEITSNELERAYRVFKTLGINDKLVVKHIGCTKPKKCFHIRNYFLKYKEFIPPRRFRHIENMTGVARIE
ncbi:hypothetical protein CMI37_13260 [Candidatus Pacearchaeota archaeon]|nr:hypothetical protein [Candidatus Pacearchaeota archaeon]|tara:strand:+ start:4315 stop:4899 length:585 start_codon:yes stop_codon:yes gene_type:complete